MSLGGAVTGGRSELNLMLIGLLWMAELLLGRLEWEGKKIGFIMLGLTL